jgi:hypothetical protein
VVRQLQEHAEDRVDAHAAGDHHDVPHAGVQAVCSPSEACSLYAAALEREPPADAHFYERADLRSIVYPSRRRMAALLYGERESRRAWAQNGRQNPFGNRRRLL